MHIGHWVVRTQNADLHMQIWHHIKSCWCHLKHKVLLQSLCIYITVPSFHCLCITWWLYHWWLAASNEKHSLWRNVNVISLWRTRNANVTAVTGWKFYTVCVKQVLMHTCIIFILTAEIITINNKIWTGSHKEYFISPRCEAFTQASSHLQLLVIMCNVIKCRISNNSYVSLCCCGGYAIGGLCQYSTEHMCPPKERWYFLSRKHRKMFINIHVNGQLLKCC